MIRGIGVDSVELKRFAHWDTYGDTQLARIFSPTEIRYCLKEPSKKRERLAVRFAAKEAFYKALSSFDPLCIIPFMTLCNKVSIKHTQSGIPQLEVDWNFLEKQCTKQLDMLKTHVSLSHSKESAVALVILESPDGDHTSSNNLSDIVNEFKNNEYDVEYQDNGYEEDDEESCSLKPY